MQENLYFSSYFAKIINFQIFLFQITRSATRSVMLFQNVPHKARDSIHTMSKQQYRSEMGIMGDILDVTLNGGQQGVIVSAISRRANLSHYAVLD